LAAFGYRLQSLIRSIFTGGLATFCPCFDWLLLTVKTANGIEDQYRTFVAPRRLGTALIAVVDLTRANLIGISAVSAIRRVERAVCRVAPGTL
jgi:hypothetical protein